MSDAAARLGEIRREITAAARANGREPAEVTLVAVSKTKPAALIEETIAAGQRVFGENYVQEAKEKWPALQARHPDLELHMIGPLQSNKARDAVALFDVIESLDRTTLAKELSKEIARQGRRPILYVQVNIGEEQQKGGVAPQAVDDFLVECRDVHGLEVSGVMAIPPENEPPAPYFALLSAIARRNGLKTISMGMSADYPVAIALGATHVRVGSAIFGARSRSDPGQG